MFRKLDRDHYASREVTITIDGIPMLVEEGEPVAAALLRAPPFTTRATPISGEPRAPFCMMGVCFDCLVEVDGEASVRSCLTRAREGMTVRRQLRRPGPANGIAA